jgi:hypothetical protein
MGVMIYIISTYINAKSELPFTEDRERELIFGQERTYLVVWEIVSAKSEAFAHDSRNVGMFETPRGVCET